MIEDVLGCTDVRNNKAFFDKQISCTNNAMSILIVGKRDFPEIAKVTDHGLNPQGPKGRFHLYNPQSHAIASHASDPAPADPARLRGWPARAGPALSESNAKYVLVDMFAKACRGDATKDVIATAAA